MTRLTDYFGPLQRDHEYIVQTSAHLPVGRCKYTEIADSLVRCQGEGQVLFFKGSFDVTIELLQDKRSGGENACRVTSSGDVDDQASYFIDGDGIVIRTRELAGGEFRFSRNGNDTTIGTPFPKPDLRIAF